MRRRRQQITEEQIGELLRENTFGGSREGRHAKKVFLPVIQLEDGIKVEWDGHPGEYPPIIHLKMTDGSWIKYQIYVEQPVFSPALADLEKMQRGYPRRKR